MKMVESDMKMVDWSGLLPELVVEIAKGIAFHEDFLSFSKVCSSWQSATRNCDDSQHLPSRYPSLLRVDDNHQQECQIHLMDGTVRKVRLPLPKTKVPDSKVLCFSSTGGWLLIFEEDTTSPKLFHPFFDRQIDLPDFKSLPSDEFVILRERFCDNRAQVCRVVLSSDPTTEENEKDLIVMILCGSRGCLAFCKPSDSSWTAVPKGWNSQVIDICYYKGKGFTLDGRGQIRSCDLHSKNPEMLLVSERPVIGLEGIRCIGYDHILPPWDDNPQKLLFVYHRCIECSYSDEEMKKFKMEEYEAFFMTQSILVFECDLETGKWSKVENLGNKAIFVGLSSPFMMEATGCIKPNCIYFTDNTGNKDFMGDAGNVGKLDMGVYHLSDGSLEPHFRVQSLSLKHNPMWIAPPNL